MEKNKGVNYHRLISYGLQGIIAFFLVIGAMNNILKTDLAVANSKVFGYAESTLVPLALYLLAGTMLYVFPRTSILGAIILSVWFGGAVATHIIHGDSFGIMLPPITFGVFTWIAIGIRDEKVRSLFLIKK